LGGPPPHGAGGGTHPDTNHARITHGSHDAARSAREMAHGAADARGSFC
jgi:hypothetical protein